MGKELEALRESYKPEKVRVLLVGESPPKRGFFYDTVGSALGKATKEAFEEVFGRELEYREFLQLFKEVGFYLLDLFSERGKVIRRASRSEREEAVKRLTEFVAKNEPEVVVAVLKRICRVVREGVKRSGLKVEFVCLPFPTYSKTEYVEGVVDVLVKFRENTSHFGSR